MEVQILRWFESLHNPITDPIMYAITSLGNAGIFWILLTILMLTVMPKKYRKVGFTMAIALILSLIFCNGIMKNLWQRPRAFWVEGQPFVVGDQFENLYGIFYGVHDYSFPSGHASASFAAALAILMWRKKEGIAATILAALIAFSRLYLTVHYPSDVLVGLVSGSLYGVIAYFIVKWIIKKFPRANAVFEQEKPWKSLFKSKKVEE
ncbi:MAG: phosphatase PAP2 family protein [Eubacteriales bacterium]|nr:phosphatase PAP2 family protein [Eubacteriales bacterium]